MAELPQFKRILREDIKGAPSWMNIVIGAFNDFAESVYRAFNKGINDINLASQIKELTYITPSGYPTMSNVTFLSELKSKAIGCVHIQVFDNSTYTPPPGPVYVPWIENDGTIIIYPITGLEASKTYTIRLRLF